MTLLWSSLASTIMVQIGRRGTVRRRFENLKKISKITEFEFQNSGPSLLRLCLLCIVKKFHSILPKLTEERHFEVCPYLCNASPDTTPPSTLQAPTRCGMLVAQRTTPFAAGKVWVWHRHAAKRYVQKLNIGRVHKFGMDRVWTVGIWAWPELGIGHDVRRAFRTGGILTWGCNRAIKINRLVIFFTGVGHRYIMCSIPSKAVWLIKNDFWCFRCVVKPPALTFV